MKHVSLVHINAEYRMGKYSEHFSKMAVFLCLMWKLKPKSMEQQNAAITIFVKIYISTFHTICTRGRVERVCCCWLIKYASYWVSAQLAYFIPSNTIAGRGPGQNVKIVCIIKCIHMQIQRSIKWEHSFINSTILVQSCPYQRIENL